METPDHGVAVHALCAAQSPTSRGKTDDPIRHGRQEEHRTVKLYEADNKLGQSCDGLIVAIARVNRQTYHRDTKAGMWLSTEARSYYISQITLHGSEMPHFIRCYRDYKNK